MEKVVDKVKQALDHVNKDVSDLIKKINKDEKAVIDNFRYDFLRSSGIEDYKPVLEEVDEEIKEIDSEEFKKDYVADGKQRVNVILSIDSDLWEEFKKRTNSDGNSLLFEEMIKRSLKGKKEKKMDEFTQKHYINS